MSKVFIDLKWIQGERKIPVTPVENNSNFGKDDRSYLFTQKELRHIAKEIIQENDDVYPNDSHFWSEFFKRAGIDFAREE